MGFQMPAPATSIPQSHPNELAILRSWLYSWWLTRGSAPSRSARALASATGAAKVTTRELLPARRTSRTSQRNDRCMFCVRPTSTPLSSTVATVSRPRATRSCRAAPPGCQSKVVA
jgi:hypothetical protein